MTDEELWRELAAEPTCPRHPKVVSYVKCQRCGLPTCPACQRVAAVGVHCVECVKAAQSNVKPLRSKAGLRARSGRPIVTLSLIAINVAIFILGSIRWGEGGTYQLGLYPGAESEEPWRLVTSGFAHFDLFHIGLNMLALFQFGTAVEALVGRVRFLLLYGLSLLGGSLVIVLVGRWALHAGASGAIYGVLAAYIVLSIALKRPAYEVMALGAVWLFMGFVVPGLSWEGHLGGAIVGAATAFVYSRIGKNAGRLRG